MHWIKDVFPLIIANLLIFFTLATLKIHGKSTPASRNSSPPIHPLRPVSPP